MEKPPEHNAGGFFRFGLSALMNESAAFGIVAIAGTGAVNIDGCCHALAVIIVGALMRFAVNLDFFAAAVLHSGVFHSTVIPFAEASAACLVSVLCFVADDLNIASGAELVLIVKTGCSRTV